VLFGSAHRELRCRRFDLHHNTSHTHADIEECIFLNNALVCNCTPYQRVLVPYVVGILEEFF